ncbi:3',5'-cyclic-nucleotide phosphodiesterase [Helicobacter magdeburgensis]|uniref:3',5'-cyclic-nucleotide phosphodiesterase n=1 Tax=Helicobacter magdeburgensis TaxID=471858 RepID=A0A4U8T0J5_9HELI|nr:phosphoesterase [Helicobacter magdeburgensis]TLD92855.1 3',5'-cyclic-nucleotide phosphodiesterase [Helicobacter magdeburgensis]
MQVYHLSHTDLDGYGCQFIAKEFFKNITFYNANYGREVLVRINAILDTITHSSQNLSTLLSQKFGKSKKSPASNASQNKFLVLITDLNLTLNESNYLQQRIEELKINGVDVELLLLDHHISGQECADKYEWYHLDSTRCASKITFDTLILREKMLDSTREKWISNVSKMINSVDIWLEDGYKFDFGKVAMGAISGSFELNRFMFDEEHRFYKFAILESAREFLEQPNGEVAFDNALYEIKKRALGGNPQTETMDTITSNAQVKLLSQKKDSCTIFYNDKKGFLSYSMGGVSVLANLFLRTNSEYDFYLDVNPRGNVSLRANGNCDVSEMSRELFNGGGHKNASGGKIEGFKESFSYVDIKSQIEYILNKNQEIQ